MTAHTCKTLTDGCYRCDLNRDEIAAMAAMDRADASTVWTGYAVAENATFREVFIAGFVAGRQS